MFLTEEKLAARIAELEPYRYRDAIAIHPLWMREDTSVNPPHYPPDGDGWRQVSVGERWRGRDKYIWLKGEVHVPSEWQGKTVLFYLDLGSTGDGNNTGYEALFYWNEVPYQGVDGNHKEVFLPPDVAGKSIRLMVRAWSGLEGGGVPREMEHRLQRAELVWLDEVVDDLYYTAMAALQTVQCLETNRPERIALLQALDRAFREIDWSEPGTKTFYASAAAARATLLSELQRFHKVHGVTVRCVGHAHIDVAWLWRLRHTREKAARTFATVLRLMERYPEFVFLQSQPQLYSFVKEDYPQLYEQIRQRIAEGRWEPTGGMWLEADCNLPSGESLVRQLLHGTRFFQSEFGINVSTLWLPDTFGYSAALPQILKKAGFKVFVTTKLSWNQYNQMPHHTFWWRGIDGTTVLAHFLTTPSTWPGAVSTMFTYNGEILARTIQGTWENYKDKDVTHELLLAFGYGDGGGGPTRDMLELRRRLDLMPGIPYVVTGRADEFFEQLYNRVEHTDRYIHVWDGELYLEYHRGTYTSQAWIKRMNRKLELMLREAEWLGVMASVARRGFDYPRDELEKAWQIVLRNQFHDILPGSSIREVYEDARREYSEAEKIVRGVWSRLTGVLSRTEPQHCFTVFNGTPWKRTDVVFVSDTRFADGKWKDEYGKDLVSQRTKDGWLVVVEDVPPFAAYTLYFEEGDMREGQSVHQGTPFELRTRGIVTPFYEIEWNDDGHIIRIHDRKERREVLPTGTRANVFQVFEDKPLRFEAWDIDIFYQEKMEEVRTLISVDVVEVGPIRAVVRFMWNYRTSSIRQDMIVYTHSRRIDFVTQVDWHEQRKLLKVAFPVDIRTTEATYDIQFGNIRRPTHWNTTWDVARFEVVGHQWADLSERGYGVSLLNDCKYGYDIHDNIMRLSLIKTAMYPDPQSDVGYHVFTYSLLPHKGDWLLGGTVQEAWYLNNPLIAVSGAALLPGRSLFRITGADVMVDAVKLAEDGDRVVLRLHEYGGGRGRVQIESDFPIVTWQECDLLERPIGVERNSPSVEFEIRPYEIRTFLVCFSKLCK